MKVWLHVSKDEQRKRLLSRLTEPEKHWKFSQQDIEERKLWTQYMDAYATAVNATSRSWAPWHVIPADDKPFMRMHVTEILTHTLVSLDLHYPTVSKAQTQSFATFRMQRQA